MRSWTPLPGMKPAEVGGIMLKFSNPLTVCSFISPVYIFCRACGMVMGRFLSRFDGSLVWSFGRSRMVASPIDRYMCVFVGSCRMSANSLLRNVDRGSGHCLKNCMGIPGQNESLAFLMYLAML